MNSSERQTLWDSIEDYQRRNPASVHPPSERIDPNAPGAHFWVILVKNWDKLHPLIQDVLYSWYNAVSGYKPKEDVKLDPKSTEALIQRLENLDDKITEIELERSNLEEELNIRDRDFQTLRKISGRKQKENIEVQQELGKSFQTKIMNKQKMIEEKEEEIQNLKEQIRKLKQEKVTPQSDVGELIQDNALREELEEKNEMIDKLTEKITNINEQYSDIFDEKERYLNEIEHLQKELSQKEKTNDVLRKMIDNLKDEVEKKDEQIKQIKNLLLED
ncbi:MAG: hypothetical protein U9O98_07650 [Asgard group archaeon]|nr:hypothetical protein [Asgard group archaeon]